MFYAEIVAAVEKLKKRYREDDPFLLCKAMGIKLIFQSLGTAPDAIKGFILKSKRIIAITINSNLPLVIQKIIVAHELGHAVLHKNSGVFAFHEVTLFDNSSRYEKDANLFAAEYLLEDDRVLETLNADNTFFSAAAALYVLMELLDFKFRVMKWKGYKLVAPRSAHGATSCEIWRCRKMQTTMNAKPPKVYVAVKADFREDGVMLPREITWEDGRKYEIDRVTDIRQAAAMKAGGQGDRYTVMISGHQSYLFFERSTAIAGNNIGRWFVERR